MTYEEAIELVKGWPEDRTVPRKLAVGIAEAADEDVAIWLSWRKR